ncbi:uncharacterized protein G2W53_040075 [Senna tora]|uniref:Uncharacterized protein n=1 Tax=Senna tora TaxID=362788 RepID=A0A834T294_9FABA|nr:uncharacterized protein G2W53_040075 [Senna tora]
MDPYTFSVHSPPQPQAPSSFSFSLKFFALSLSPSFLKCADEGALFRVLESGVVEHCLMNRVVRKKMVLVVAEESE